MKKLLMISIIFFSLFFVSSCFNENRLKPPHHLSIDEMGILRWEAEGENLYIVFVNDVEYRTSSRDFNLGIISLEVGIYDIRVKTISTLSQTLGDSIYSPVIKYEVFENRWLRNAIYYYFTNERHYEEVQALEEASNLTEQLYQLNQYASFNDQQLFFLFVYITTNEAYIDELNLFTLSKFFSETEWEDDLSSKAAFSFQMFNLNYLISEFYLYFSQKEMLLQTLENIEADLIKRETAYLNGLSAIENNQYYLLLQEIEMIEINNNDLNQSVLKYWQLNLIGQITNYDYLFKVWSYEAAIRNQEQSELISLETTYPWFINIRDLLYTRYDNDQEIIRLRNELEKRPESEIASYHSFEGIKRQYFGELEEIDEKRQTIEQQIAYLDQRYDSSLALKNEIEKRRDFYLINQDDIIMLLDIYIKQICPLSDFDLLLPEFESLIKTQYSDLSLLLEKLIEYETVLIIN